MRAFKLCIVIITCDLWTCIPGFGYRDCIDGHNSLGNMKAKVILFSGQQFGKYESKAVFLTQQFGKHESKSCFLDTTVWDT